MDSILDHFDLIQWFETIIVFVVSVTIHEFAHAFTADRLGDNTPRSQGRISLNPIDHLDLVGTILMAVSAATGFGIGWGKPVEYNPGNLKSPRWDPLKIAIAGPISNMLQAIALASVLRFDDHYGWFMPGSWIYDLISLGVLLNINLAMFNMIPIPPLDGSKVLSALLPTKHAERYDRVMSQVGLILFFLVALTGITRYLIGPPSIWTYTFLIGHQDWEFRF
ncbi:MAG TPA: site-2 protease family protein [Capsulimonadaceae bacterium]|nr:site-2 protease family protein [Capsulimonadaceae bacterium]